MLQHSLYKVVQEEQRALAARIAEEERRDPPDSARLHALREQWADVRRELERFPDHSWSRETGAA